MAHVYIEKPRWQLVPAYTSAVLLAMLPLTEDSLASTWIRRGAVVLVLLTLVLGYLVPLFTLPPLSGEHKVGTTDIETVDTTRPMWVNDEDPVRRRLRVQLWYPTDDTSGTKAPYWPDLARRGPAFAREFKLPPYVLNHFELIDSRSYTEAFPMPSKEPLPLVIFSHGYSGSRSQSTILCEDLASHGFIVAAVEHTCDSTLSIFKDRSTVPFRGMENFPDSLQKARHYRRKQAGIRANDLVHVLDVLERMNAEDPRWRGKIDFTRVGVMGHSFGGCTAILTAYQEPRIKACISMDGWMWPLPEFLTEENSTDEAAGSREAKGEHHQISQPVLLLDAPHFMGEKEEYTMHNRAHASRVVHNSGRGSMKVVVNKSHHHDFSDVSFMAPIFTNLIGLTGYPDGYQMQHIMLEFSLMFFNEHVCNKAIKEAKGLQALQKQFPAASVRDQHLS